MNALAIRSAACLAIAITLSGCYYAQAVPVATTAAPPQAILVSPPVATSGTIIVQPSR